MACGRLHPDPECLDVFTHVPAHLPKGRCLNDVHNLIPSPLVAVALTQPIAFSKVVLDSGLMYLPPRPRYRFEVLEIHTKHLYQGRGRYFQKVSKDTDTKVVSVSFDCIFTIAAEE